MCSRATIIAIRCILVVLLTTLYEARIHGRPLESDQFHRSSNSKNKVLLKSLDRLNKYSSLGYSDFNSYGSPSSLPLAPFNSIIAPQTSTPSFPITPSLPAYSPVPNPPHNVFGPPSPSTGTIISTKSPPPPPPLPPPPPPYGSSQPKHAPNPPQIYLPPVVYPPPPSSSNSSPHHKKPPQQYAVWCVAKPTVPDPIIKAAMDYACGSGAECKSIQPNGPCYYPNTMLAHASYAFNSYWQNSKAAGGTCDFGGTAMLVTVNPSYGKCQFVLI
ncbi:hypothetical protein PIB30_056559 [Stylosanthes scabra]|uniref:X8 domain-containing protein n=1 Tax=Stylosanthes scabra TaxID=79078 RepID=A0ABU6XHA8_9FABA|nr:hypothetical protein [Stylosanthes scabra]